MRNRQANGSSKSGRYKAEDTARLKYIHCTGFPLLQKGLLPLPHDIQMLELGPLDTLRGQDKVNLEQWVRKHYSDPRCKNKVKLNDMQQTSILEWCSLNTQLLSKPSTMFIEYPTPVQTMFFWDTESVTYVTGLGTNEQRCSLVQVCVSNQLTVLFHVGTWTTMFASFQSLFEDDSTLKVAHYVQHDLKHLTSKFPSLNIKKESCFLKTCPEFFPPGAPKGLDEIVKRVSGVHLNKRIDHSMWCVPGLFPRHITYVVLDVYALLKMYTKYIEAPVKDSVSLFVSQVSILEQDEEEYSQTEATQRRQGRGLPTLRAKLRSTAPEAPRSVHRPPTLSPNLGTASPLPLAQVPGSPSAVTGTIDQLEMEIDPNSHTHSETSRKRGGGSRGGKSGAERIRDFRNNQTPEEKEKEKQKDRDRKKAKRGGGASG